jgi:phage terminase Nu1 subunit (DNA packaging protein)
MKNKNTTPPPAPAAAMIAADRLAELCNLTPRRLYQLAETGKIPPASNGQFPMLATITALFSFYQRDGEEIQKERLAKLTAERKMTELKLALEQGNSIPTEDVFEAWADLIMMMKQRLLSAGHNLQSTGKLNHDQRLAVDAEITGALSELARKINYRADAEEKAQSAAKENPRK